MGYRAGRRPAVDSFQLRRQNGRYTPLMNRSNVYTGFAIRATPLSMSRRVAQRIDSASAFDICEQRPSTWNCPRLKARVPYLVCYSATR